MSRLEGKRVVVTGAGSGLGRAMAERFAAEGAAVVCADIAGEAASAAAAAVVAAGGRAEAVTADVRSEADAERTVARATSAFGGLDVMVANAGVGGNGRVDELALDDWNAVLAVNLTGVFLSAKAAVRQLLRQGTGGSIIATASVAASIGIPRVAPYAAAKAGVIGLVRQMAVDYGPERIRVNAISPATVATPLVLKTYGEGGSFAAGSDASVDELLAESAATRFPLRRLGLERDVAEAALYLAADESSWVTGHVLVVDGGMTVQ
jgi:NAD(P)-dependent dehydrogenase (short-subunit alcohol dehydrogenase family)